ncbi:MAG: endonuclease/exonuclease/phosphatase family protein [Deltaproteobacteria bacterium]|nr:endonuclease/exonuclease/phosphatase family protein [Deltaproteobacteria bacterium]
MRVMTFNIRFENDQDDANAWVHRRDMIVDLIVRHRPDILGTQEGKRHQLIYLRDRLPGYVLHAPGRMMDERSQYPTLFIRRDTLERVGGEEFWLSKTPHTSLSMNWDSAFPRMFSAAQLISGEEPHCLWAAVTHLDHMGPVARLRQGAIIARWASQRTAPVIIMGDFNDGPGSAVHEVLTAPETGMADSWICHGGTEGPASYTHHGFQGTPRITRMDWILTSSRFRVTNTRIVRDNINGRYPSDHFPYMIDIERRRD